MNDLRRRSRRVRLAKTHSDKEENGSYVISTFFNGTFHVCKMTGTLKRYETFGGRIFGGPDVFPEHDILCDNYLNKIDSMNIDEWNHPTISFFPDDEIKNLPPDIQSKLLYYRNKAKRDDFYK